MELDQDSSEGEDPKATSKILSGSILQSDDDTAVEPDDTAVEPVVQLTHNTKVLPPIERSEAGVQTDITLMSGSHISTFRPGQLVEEMSPYPPLPVIATTSAPALLKGLEKVTEVESDDKAKDDKSEEVPVPESVDRPLTNEDSRSDFQPTDEEETASSYSAVSELEGVGPPTILQYIKESARVRRCVPSPKPLSERFPTVDPSVERANMCPFCHTELLPVPPLSDGSEDETDTPAPDIRASTSPPYNIKDSEKGDAGTMNNVGAMSVFSVESPPPMLGHPEDNDDDRLPLDGYLYCCEDYYWHLVNKCRIERRDSFYQEGEAMEVKKIDVSPHAPFGSKAARKLAKDRASESSEPLKPKSPVKPKPRLTPLAQLVRERELEKVRPLGGPPRAGGGATTLFSYARQMKTINFALSSRKCMEDGWTVTNYVPPPKTPEPVLYDTVDLTQSHPLPGLSVPWQQNCTEFHRYYRNGTVFLTLFPDGTGACYYPSGAPAIVITLEKPGIYCYNVLSDSDYSVKLLAVCSQQGRITVFHANATIHYQCSPIEGNIFNDQEVRTKHWEWDAFQPHVHAPPFQPAYFQISPYLSMRCVSLEQQTLVFSYRRYTFKCSVGSRTKKLLAKPLEQPQLLQYNRDLQETKNKINENLKKLNACISSAQHLPQKEVKLLESRKSSPRKSPESNRVTLAV